MSTSISAIGRAAGPALTGIAFTIGVGRGYIIAPWWLLTMIAIFAAIPVFWLTEMEGFGGKDDDPEDKQDEREEETGGETNDTSTTPGASLRTAPAIRIEDSAEPV